MLWRANRADLFLVMPNLFRQNAPAIAAEATYEQCGLPMGDTTTMPGHRRRLGAVPVQ